MYKKIINHVVLAGVITSACPQTALLCKQSVAKIASLQGKVDIKRDGNSQWQMAYPDDGLCLGDKVKTLENGRVIIRFSNEAVAILGNNSLLVLTELEKNNPL